MNPDQLARTVQVLYYTGIVSETVLFLYYLKKYVAGWGSQKDVGIAGICLIAAIFLKDILLYIFS